MQFWREWSLMNMYKMFILFFFSFKLQVVLDLTPTLLSVRYT